LLYNISSLGILWFVDLLKDLIKFISPFQTKQSPFTQNALVFTTGDPRAGKDLIVSIFLCAGTA
jgi:hypothetical protein